MDKTTFISQIQAQIEVEPTVHENALMVTCLQETFHGEVKAWEGIFRADEMESALSSADPVKSLLTRSESNLSLPERARYELVPKKWLELAFNDLYDRLYGYDKEARPAVSEMAKSLDYVPLFLSGYDHTLWDIHGQQIVAPTVCEVWGSQYRLPELAEHLNAHQWVVQVKIEENSCSQNWGISGRELLFVTLKVPYEQLVMIQDQHNGGKPVSPNRLKEILFWVHEEGSANDLLGVWPYRLSEEESHQLCEDADRYQDSW